MDRSRESCNCHLQEQWVEQDGVSTDGQVTVLGETFSLPAVATIVTRHVEIFNAAKFVIFAHLSSTIFHLLNRETPKKLTKVKLQLLLLKTKEIISG